MKYSQKTTKASVTFPIHCLLFIICHAVVGVSIYANDTYTMSKEAREKALLHVRTETSKQCENYGIDTKASKRDIITADKTDIRGIDIALPKLMKEYSRFGSCLTVSKHDTSYTSNIKNEIHINIVLSYYLQFRASYPLVEQGKAQKAINALVNTRLKDFKKQAQKLLQGHHCYYLDPSVCDDDIGATSITYRAYLKGKAWYSSSPDILNVHFVIDEGVNSLSGKNTTLLFKAQNGTKLSYDDIFINTDNALNRITALSADALFSQLKELRERPGTAISGLCPSRKNYHSMAFDNEGNFLVFFDKYQVAWGAAGRQIIKIPIKDIQYLLKEDL